MLDIRLIRENPKAVEENIRKRRDPEKLKLLRYVIGLDAEWRKSLRELEALRREKNILSREIAGKGGAGKIEKTRKLSEGISRLEEETGRLGKKVKSSLLRIPNILHESVPYGKDDEDNVEIRKWGTVPKFGFRPKNHMELLEGLGLIDAERASRVSGHGFYYLKNELALLDMALLRYAVDFLIKKGYMLVEPPFMLRGKPYTGVIDMEFFREQLYKIEGDDLYLIATAEHPLAAIFMNEVLEKKDLPVKLVGVSPCFRREIGTHGKYTKGLFRMHQFNKVEQFVFCLPEDSWKYMEELQVNAELLYRGLGLPYRVMNVCTGDIGTIAAKKYDTDVWMADGKFREIGSNSNCTDYQARRLNIRYREKEGAPPAGLVHTLNNTAIATSRTMLALLEVHQQSDGSVTIPPALRPYMNGMKVLGKK